MQVSTDFSLGDRPHCMRRRGRASDQLRCHHPDVRRYAPIFALLTLSPSLPGCQPCTLAGCGPAVEIVVGSEEDPIDPMAGTIAVDLDLDGARYEVVCTRAEPRCEVERPEFDFRVSGIHYGDRIEIEIYGSEALAPDSIDVYIAVDDEEVFETSLSPEYEDREINGEGCTTCRSTLDDPFVLPGS